MPTSARGAWGPHPVHALLPAIVAIGFSGWVWYANRGPLPADGQVAVTALRPIDGPVAADADLPIEVRYGVPTERTLHLWPPASRG